MHVFQHTLTYYALLIITRLKVPVAIPSSEFKNTWAPAPKWKYA